MNEPENSTYVEETGLAVVHRGERVVAAPGSEAVLSTHRGGDVHYYFPVHVVIAGDLPEAIKSEIEARIWDGLQAALA